MSPRLSSYPTRPSTADATWVCPSFRDPSHEKTLNCIDGDNDSRILVTTRIRGLLKNSTELEMGLLSPDDALKLLLSSADLQEAWEVWQETNPTCDPDLQSDEHRIALEICELCGFLPLALAIAGGMTADQGQGFTEDVLEHLRESRDLEDEEGMTLENRVIASSLKMLNQGQGKNKALVEKVFRFFAVFPEDVPVPASFFNTFAPTLTNETSDRKARITVGSSLGTLLKYNLIKGSLSAGSGVFMHDIVRDFVINEHSSKDLRALQQTVVEVILAARPEGGFRPSGFSAASSFEGYATRQLFWHFRGALLEGEEPPDAWITHPDRVVMGNVSVAVGLHRMTALSETREAAGELVRAAQASWASSMMKGLPQATLNDLVHHSAELLERADDSDIVEFELEVLALACIHDFGSPRNLKVVSRQRALAKVPGLGTHESKLAEALTHLSDVLVRMGLFGAERNLEAALESVREMARLFVEAGNLSDNPSIQNYCLKIHSTISFGYVCAAASSLESWNPDDFSGGEEGLVEGE